MGEGYYGVSDEFIMYVIAPLIMLLVGYPLSKWIDRQRTT